MADVGVELFQHNLWANLRLLDNCAQLSEEDLAASAPGTYGKVLDTLVHLFASEGRYVAEFNGRTDDMLSEDQPFVGFDKLRDYATKSGHALLDIAASKPANRILKGMYRDQPYQMAASVLLVQAINHASEHRTHIIGILSERLELPPREWRMDGVAYLWAGANVPQ